MLTVKLSKVDWLKAGGGGRKVGKADKGLKTVREACAPSELVQQCLRSLTPYTTERGQE